MGWDGGSPADTTNPPKMMPRQAAHTGLSSISDISDLPALSLSHKKGRKTAPPPTAAMFGGGIGPPQAQTRTPPDSARAKMDFGFDSEENVEENESEIASNMSPTHQLDVS